MKEICSSDDEGSNVKATRILITDIDSRGFSYLTLIVAWVICSVPGTE